MKKNRALFISHFDEKSGAPKALYNILKFILTNYELQVDVLVCQPKKIGFFENLANEPNIKTKPLITYDNSYKKSKFLLINKLENFIRRLSASVKLKKTIKNYNKKYDFIFFNSVSYNYFETELNKIVIPKFLYLHEGSIFLDETLNGDYSFFKNFNHIFVPSLQVKKNLIKQNLDKYCITVLQLFLDENELISNANRIELKKDFVVGNLAVFRPNKAMEYFLATVKLYKELYPTDNIIFKWKGVKFENSMTKVTRYEIENANLQNTVFLEEYSENASEFFQTIDVLLVTSKQETFSFVVLEAANNSKPSIVFDDVVGASDFVKEYGGIVVDYLSIKQIVDGLKKYYENRELLNQHGKASNELLRSKYSYNNFVQTKLKTQLSILFENNYV